MKLRYLTILNKVKKTVKKSVSRLKSEGDRRDISSVSLISLSLSLI